jgi:AraC-like DNA-binding protein
MGLFVNSLLNEIIDIYKNRRSQSSICEGPGKIWTGMETRYPGEAYRFDGMRRPIASPCGREVIFQFTLSGEGRYAEGTREWKVPAGFAFFAFVPSEHVYWMPATVSEPWTYFFFIIEHPYVTERLRQLNSRRGPVAGLSRPEVRASVLLLKETSEQRHAGEIEQERALLDWWLTLEQAACRSSHSPRAKLLGQVQAFTRANLKRSFGIEELAAEWRMSRSHFSHYFRRITGHSPAKVVLEVRIAEAARLLSGTGEPLSRIAAETGFADANHFGKAFRRVRGITPGQFRESRRIGP